MAMTPAKLKILLHYYATPSDHAAINGSCFPFRELVEDGLLKNSTDTKVRFYEITDRGNVYVGAVLKVPLPKQTWVVDYSDN